MFSVIFEVCPKQERFDDYLGLAKQLKPVLEKIDGFVDNERFESKRRPGWLLSHSTWRDEKAVVRWRTVGEHHATQERGRNEIFRDYHLRVGDVTFDTDPPASAPVHEQRLDVTQVGAAKMVTFTEVVLHKDAADAGQPDSLLALVGLDLAKERAVVDHDVFASIYTPGKLALLVSWADAAAASSWMPSQRAGLGSLRHRRVRVIRDYGMFERREAPQYFPEVARP
jgi:heme-degrading monooxygenase HmoA